MVDNELFEPNVNLDEDFDLLDQFQPFEGLPEANQAPSDTLVPNFKILREGPFGEIFFTRGL